MKSGMINMYGQATTDNMQINAAKAAALHAKQEAAAIAAVTAAKVEVAVVAAVEPAKDPVVEGTEVLSKVVQGVVNTTVDAATGVAKGATEVVQGAAKLFVDASGRSDGQSPNDGTHTVSYWSMFKNGVVSAANIAKDALNKGLAGDKNNVITEVPSNDTTEATSNETVPMNLVTQPGTMLFVNGNDSNFTNGTLTQQNGTIQFNSKVDSTALTVPVYFPELHGQSPLHNPSDSTAVVVSGE